MEGSSAPAVATTNVAMQATDVAPVDPPPATLATIPAGLMKVRQEDLTAAQVDAAVIAAVSMQEVVQPPSPSKYVNNDFAHESHFINQGAIIQVRTNQCNDAAEVIGAIRIPVSDHLDIMGYITENRPMLKDIAIGMLKSHMRACNHHISINEDIANEDYSESYSVASVTASASLMNATSRNEGGMWMLMYPTYLCAQRADILDPRTHRSIVESWQYLINLFIHLNEAGRRGTTVLRRIRLLEEEKLKAEAKAAAASAAAASAPAHGARDSGNRDKEAGNQKRFGGYQGPRTFWNSGKDSQRQEALESKIDEVHQMLRNNLKANYFPPTPAPEKPLVWKHTGISAVPPARS